MSAHPEIVISRPDFPLAFRQEADHRIANSLQIISALVRQRARSGTISNPKTFLMEVADRIDTVGKLHRLLAESATETVQLGSYLTEICKRLTEALAPTATSFAVDCPADCPLPAKIALPLALITAELVSNSLKYAHPAGLPTKITLTCSRNEDGDLTIVYEDDGVGFPEKFDLEGPSHMGIRFIQLLSKSVAASARGHSDALGVRFQIALSTAF